MRRFLATFAVVVLVLGSVVRANEPPATPAPTDLHLFLLVGQSNMAGRGAVGAEDTKPHPRVLVFNREQQWVPAVDPLHFDKVGAGVGPGRTFGLDIANANPDITVGLIPCAHGGSSISSWVPGGYHDQTKGYPYDETLTRAKVALKNGQLKGILWHQGEGDANPERSGEYAVRLKELVERLRKDLDAPDVPFLVGQLGQFPESPWSDDKRRVDAAHRALPDILPNVAFVSSDGLQAKSDRVHFDADSARELGHRYAKAYLTFQNNGADAAVDRVPEDASVGEIAK